LRKQRSDVRSRDSEESETEIQNFNTMDETFFEPGASLIWKDSIEPDARSSFHFHLILKLYSMTKEAQGLELSVPCWNRVGLHLEQSEILWTSSSQGRSFQRDV